MTDGIPRADRELLDYSGAVPLGLYRRRSWWGCFGRESNYINRPHIRRGPYVGSRLQYPLGAVNLDLPHYSSGGEVGVETWQEESWRYTGNGGVWTQMSADLELGYVYLPTEAPTNDYYGAIDQGIICCRASLPLMR